MNKILVSSCLLGEAVRYDGKDHLLKNKILEQWIRQNSVVSFCPEVAGGMSIPRIAAEIIDGDGHDVLAGTASVLDKSGNNVTHEFTTGAQLALSMCNQLDIKMAILSRRSPSCGNKTIYDGSFTGSRISGAGVTAALLQQNGIRVFSQTELHDAAKFMSKLQ